MEVCKIVPKFGVLPDEGGLAAEEVQMRHPTGGNKLAKARKMPKPGTLSLKKFGLGNL